MVTLREKPTLEFDVDLPLGLEGTVSRQIQTWLETLVGNILETKLVWPERLVVPIGDPSTTLTLPNGEQTTQVRSMSHLPKSHMTVYRPFFSALLVTYVAVAGAIL
jgi:hypothetical protein|tara:strand:+ start:1934 stop:2251 length:318 start_codon:yes stop_codon:yes gene_type:complete